MIFPLPGGLGQIFASGGSALDPANKNAALVLSNNNLTVTGPTTALPGGCVRGTRSHTSGKYYFEAPMTVMNTQSQAIGICNSSFAIATANLVGSDSNSASAMTSLEDSNWLDWMNNAYNYHSPAAPANGDTAMLAYDFSTGNIYVGVNGLWMVTGTTTFPSNPDFTVSFNPAWPAISVATAGGIRGSVTFNPGSSPFKYPVPSGFVAWG